MLMLGGLWYVVNMSLFYYAQYYTLKGTDCIIIVWSWLCEAQTNRSMVWKHHRVTV